MPNPPSVQVVTIASATPLKVQERTGGAWITAHVAVGSIYAPAVGDSVVAVFDGYQYQLLGAKTGATTPFSYSTYTGSGFAAVGNSATKVWDLGTFTLPAAMKVRISIAASFTLSSTSQLITTIVFVDTAQPATTATGGAAQLYMLYAGMRIGQLVTTMTAKLAAGTHKLQLYGATGGGGGTLTPGYVYGEVQGAAF